MKLKSPLLRLSRLLSGGPTGSSLSITSGRERKPIVSLASRFSDLPLHPALRANLSELPFDVLTAAQRAAIPTALDGNDVMLSSETGSGKTLAFVVPLLDALLRAEIRHTDSKKLQPFGLILSPTLQLSAQHNKLVTQLLEETSFICDHLQEEKFPPKRAHILTTHPDTAMRMFDKNALSFRNCNFLVIDEADKFIHQDIADSLRKLLTPSASRLPAPPARRTVICGATLTALTQQLFQPFLLEDYVRIEADSRRSARVPASIQQDLLWSPKRGLCEQRLDLLFLSLNKIGNNKVIVFCSSSLVKRLTAVLSSRGFRAVPFSRNLSQQQQVASLDHFRQSRINVLVSSDLGSRGLDFPDVKFIINYELPNSLETYIHRIGRSGRMGKRSQVISMFGESDSKLAKDFINFLDSCGAPLPNFLLRMSDLFQDDLTIES